MDNKYTEIAPRNVAKDRFAFLSEEQQGQYMEAVARCTNEKARETLNIERNGSNIFKISLLNKIGIETASLEELGRIAEQNPEFLRGYFEDSPSVCLRSDGDDYIKNDRIAKYLAKQAKSRGFNLEQPIVISGFVPVQDSHSAYGLRLQTGEETEMFEAPELVHKKNRRKFNISDERGMPIFDVNGNRTLYTRDSGLSRLNLSYLLGLYSNWYSLGDSGSVGRVVVLDTEGVARKK